MKQYYEMFNQIKENSSRLKKEELLRLFQSDEGFKEILRFVYNPLIISGLAKTKITKTVNTESEIELKNIFEAINFVKDNNTGNDLVIATIQKFLNKLETLEEKELAISILTKDAPFGISKTTLNKVYGEDFIVKYGVQLAGRYTPGSLNGKKFALTLKLDGNRVTFFNKEDGVKGFTRSGKEVEGLSELKEYFKNLPKDRVYDGEIIAKNIDNLPSKELFNITQSIMRTNGEKTGLEFIMFDQLPISEFENGISEKDYYDRLVEIATMFDTYIEENSLIKKVPIFYIGNDESVIDELLPRVVELGYEGLMANILTGKYQTTRTKDLLKIKVFHLVDLRVLEVQEDIRGGKCGSLIVDYKGYRVGVAGLKEKEKIEFWTNPEKIIGKIIEVKYFEESENAQNGLSLRFPSYISVREDKTEASYN